MQCPVCKSLQMHTEIEVHGNGFDEEHFQCDSCGSVWSVNHGLTEIVKDTQAHSFLEVNSEPVEDTDSG